MNWLIIAASIVTVSPGEKQLDISPHTVYNVESGGVTILTPYAPGHYTSTELKKPPHGEQRSRQKENK